MIEVGSTGKCDPSTILQQHLKLSELIPQLLGVINLD